MSWRNMMKPSERRYPGFLISTYPTKTGNKASFQSILGAYESAMFKHVHALNRSFFFSIFEKRQRFDYIKYFAIYQKGSKRLVKKLF